MPLHNVEPNQQNTWARRSIVVCRFQGWGVSKYENQCHKIVREQTQHKIIIRLFCWIQSSSPRHIRTHCPLPYIGIMNWCLLGRDWTHTQRYSIKIPPCHLPWSTNNSITRPVDSLHILTRWKGNLLVIEKSVIKIYIQTSYLNPSHYNPSSSGHRDPS